MGGIVVDVETVHGGSVGRARNRVGLAGALDLQGGAYEFWTEPELEGLFHRMDAADRIVGHNIERFDYGVLDKYHTENVRNRYAAKTLDTLQHIKERHDRWVSLSELADATLAKRKRFTTAGVPQLLQTGRILEVVERNRSDVELTREIYRFGRDFGYVVARDPELGFVDLEVDWQ